jgi:predicted membrane channel-forming protein YqfA (hemolysin III family)
VPFNAQELMKWSGAIFMTLVEAYVIYGIAFKWDMKKLLCAEDGAASMSRFQLLLFTFAIAGGYFYLLMQQNVFPAVNASAMALLGISGGTYAISKGIQASRDTTLSTSQPPAPPPPPEDKGKAVGAAAGGGGTAAGAKP